jgi:hypothetical protein
MVHYNKLIYLAFRYFFSGSYACTSACERARYMLLLESYLVKSVIHTPNSVLGYE